MVTQYAYKHWKMEVDQDGILWLTIDRQGASVNSLNGEVFDEFDRVIDDIAKQDPKAVILQSGKKKGFIAGADITQFSSLETPEDALTIMRQAQVVLAKLEQLSMPTVAMISGFCLGGGYEVALACRYRVAEDNNSMRIGLPEVKLGIHPGWGGTVRLPKLIGAVKAMNIMLPGAAVPARKAAKLGMIDAAVPLRDLKTAAIYYATNTPSPQQPEGLARYSNEAYVRPWLGKLIERRLSNKVSRDHYPAPFAIIRNWIKAGVSDEAYATEAESIAELMMTSNSRNLVRDFFLREKLKAVSKKASYMPQRVHVIGAGTMGGDIAAWCALRGVTVTLQDQSPDRIAPAIKRANKLFKKKLKLPHLVQAAMDRLQPDIAGKGVAKADLVIEAIFEDLKAKQNLFKSMESQLKPDAILASNTSSICIEDISAVLQNPERLVGIHFFNPVAKMPLVEIVCGGKVSQAIIDKAASFVGQLGKLPLPVKSLPGFLVNRALMPYLLEAMDLLNSGVAARDIDRVAVKFGMPMGPIELADRVGLDVCLSVAKNLISHYGGGMVPERLQELVNAGYLGTKTGQGFYQYRNGKLIKPDNRLGKRSAPDLTDRLILRLVNEVVGCWHDKVVDDIDLLDAGMIFGTGFAPFLGGPIEYAKSRGIDEIVSTLERFVQDYGRQFTPNKGWKNLQGGGSKGQKTATKKPSPSLPPHPKRGATHPHRESP